MPARSQELKIALGFEKQAALQTALGAGSFWNLLIDQYRAPIPRFNRESNAAFFGKGHPFATQVYPTSLDSDFEFSSFLTSQNFAMVAAFALGIVQETNPATGAHQYVGTPVLETTAVELPAITIGGGIREDTSDSVLDIGLIGMVVSGVTLRIQRGPGLANTSLTIRFAGCGKYVRPFGVTIPVAYTEHRLGAGSTVQLLIGGTNYITEKTFVDLEWTWENDVKLESGYFPGSGQQDGYDIRGRMRVGNQSSRLVWTVEAEPGDSAFDDFVDGVEGTTTILLEGSEIAGGVKHTAKIEYHRMQHQALEPVDADGYSGYRITTEPLMDESDGVCTVTAITDKAGIGAEE